MNVARHPDSHRRQGRLREAEVTASTLAMPLIDGIV
jgi:hypothetical protein